MPLRWLLNGFHTYLYRWLLSGVTRPNPRLLGLAEAQKADRQQVLVREERL